jgi:hypothetical protein
MKLEYNPRNFLRLVPAPLLREYFDQRQRLQEFDWDGLADGNVEPIYGAWMALPAEERQAISVDFQNAVALCSKRGIHAILDAGASTGLDLVPTISGAKTNIEKVFRVLLDHPSVFRIASQFVWADNLSRHWHRRRDLPLVPPDPGPEALQELKAAISDYYVKNEGRGEYCNIEVYQRGEAHYLMVYLADYPSAVICFEDSDQLKRSLQQQAFDVVFIFRDKQGHLDLYAQGNPQKRKELRQMFAKYILRQDVSVDAAAEPAFDLERLKDPAFRFKIAPADGIKAMRLRSMRFAVPDGEGGRITFAVAPRSKEASLHGLINLGLNLNVLPLENLCVEHVTIQAAFVKANPGPKSVTFNLTSHNTCNLKDTPEHDKIRECLKRSEIIRE